MEGRTRTTCLFYPLWDQAPLFFGDDRPFHRACHHRPVASSAGLWISFLPSVGPVRGRTVLPSSPQRNPNPCCNNRYCPTPRCFAGSIPLQKKGGPVRRKSLCRPVAALCPVLLPDHNWERDR